MYDDLTSRFPVDGCQVDVYAFGVFLHPKYRNIILNEHNLSKTIIDKFIKENEVEVETPETEDCNDILNEGIVGEIDGFEDEDTFFRKLTQKNQPTQGQTQASQSLIPQSPLETEIARYVQPTERIESDVNVLQWWQDHSKTFPLLSNAAKKYLAIQATSCSSERTFSTGGRTVTMTRTKLAPTNVHMIVYVKENLKKVNLRQVKTSNDIEQAAEEDAELEHDNESDSDNN